MKNNHFAYLGALFLIIAVVMTCRSGVFIPTASSNLSQKTVIIDAGHGFPDGGTVSKSGIKESEINLEIAKKLKKLLSKNKVKVIMTRNDKNSLSTSETNNKRDDLNKRCHIRENSNADLFISIHLNHFGESKYRGAQVFYSENNPENKLLAECIQTKLIELADPENTRSIKSTSSIYILKNSSIPSALAECGFLSNPEEALLLSSPKYQDKIAKALYHGIMDYFEREELS